MGDYDTSVHELDWGPEFLEFMEVSGQSVPMVIRSWMSSNFGSHRGRLLGAFILVATGCWGRQDKDAHIALQAVETLDTIHSIRNDEVKAEMKSLLSDQFRTIGEKPEIQKRTDWLHNHRYQWLSTRGSHSKMADDVIKSLESLSTKVGDYDGLGEFVTDRLKEEDPFHAIFGTITGVHAYRRLPTFDFLELAYRAGQIDGLYPREPRYKYLSSNQPQPGLFLVIAGDARRNPSDVKNMSEGEVLEYLDADQEVLDEIAAGLYEAATEELGWGSKTAFFDVESCLCNFAKRRNKEYWKGTAG